MNTNLIMKIKKKSLTLLLIAIYILLPLEVIASGPVPLYHYDKYDINYGNWGPETYSFVQNAYMSIDMRVRDSYHEINWDSVKGKYVPVGSPQTRFPTKGESAWLFTNGETLSYRTNHIEGQTYGDPPNDYHWFGGHRYTREREKLRGQLIQINVIGTENQYPVNGLHTDGYWYVRTGFVNQAPRVSITSHVENKYFV